MVTFTLCLLALIAGYFIYGRFMEHVFGPDARKTPAITKADGVDYIPLPAWKIFMIQFLNIAGLGPIFGAIMGAKFGSASYLWIVLGSIFAGAVHDYFAGMLSLRHGGESLPEIIGRYLGATAKQVMRGFTVVLMILVGAVFVAGPAGLLASLTPETLDTTFWIAVVFVYYVFATLLPVDKIIGKVYPLFAIALLFMAVGILVMLYVNHPALPEVWDGLQNTHPNASALPVFPIMFVSIACGAISGFHATQSPLMARCMTSERHGRPIFYGAMITEGIVALIWAAAATCFFHENGMEETNAARHCGCHHEELAGDDRRRAGDTGCDCSSHYQRRHRVPLGTAHRCGFPGDGAKNDAPPSVHLRADVLGCYRTAAVQPARQRRVRHDMALLRMGQPDLVRLYLMGSHRLSGTCR